MTYGSICSGIESATVAWHPLGWKPAWFAEIDKFPSAVLAHHYPTVPNYGDFTKIGADVEPIDLLVGGTPCQDFSVAGLRGGLDAARGNLTLEFLALAGRLRPNWLVFENVPGILSIDGGRAFGVILGELGKLGYGFAYRILDAQHFGVPQRRRRVFVVGCLAGWRLAAAVLFERESLRGYPAPRREKREDVAPTISARTKGGGGLGTDFDLDGGLIEVAHCLNAHGGSGRIDAESETFVTHSLRGEGFDVGEDGTGRGIPLVCDTLTSNGDAHSGYRDEKGLVYPILEAGARTGVSTTDPRAGIGIGESGDPMFTLQAGKQHAVGATSGVRRLTPRECERLQGFPDDYTRIPYPRKFSKDGPRYKALGNSKAVPVVRWIGERIAMVDSLL